MHDQRIRDPIHDLIKFSFSRREDAVLWKLVQTQEFQRLRRIRQLGFSEMVYPGATHTRFSHALGAMQMARRMLAVLIRNSVVEQNPDQEMATLCAALLHDVGHGPFSHVFEEASKKCGVDAHHEQWTTRIIQDSKVADVLKEHSAKLHEDVLSFFQKEPGYNVYSSIVSSQLDADRLDFVSRDRYFTGISFGAIDPEWIFDCLRVENINIDPDAVAQQVSFVVSAKGLSAVENYLYAYTELYSKVYFHKTTRAAQIMLEHILTGILSKPEVRSVLPGEDPVRRYFEAGPSPSLTNYLMLDDFTLWNLVTWASRHELGETTDLARRLLARDLYKCFEPPHRPKESPHVLKVNDFVKRMQSGKIWYHRDKVPEKGYKAFSNEGLESLKNILVHNEDERWLRLVGQFLPIHKWHLANC